MQDNWPDGGRFSTEGLTEADVALLGEEYEVLAQIQAQLISGAPDWQTLREAAAEYVRIMDLRLAANEAYVASELEMETIEGTATYVGVQASRRVGYDLGIMYFTNQKDVPFTDIMVQYEAGNIDRSYLADRIPYETGGLLCLLTDELGVPDWQAALNAQTREDPVTLYSIIKGRVEAQAA